MTIIEYICNNTGCTKKEKRCVCFVKDIRLNEPEYCIITGKYCNWELISTNTYNNLKIAQPKGEK